MNANTGSGTENANTGSDTEKRKRKTQSPSKIILGRDLLPFRSEPCDRPA
jgi:hypothetical protein